MIYLDNSATTSLAPEVIDRMERVRSRTFGNASSVHRAGQIARVELEEARERIAGALGAEPKEIVFTSGGTEANNHALKGYATACFIESGRWPRLYLPRTEHHAILHPAELLERLGVRLVWLEVTPFGRVRPESLAALLAFRDADEPAPLVSIMHANNETGVLNPIAELAGVAREHGAIFHTDAVQSFGKIPLDVRASGVDLLSISAHKLHGPKGIGALYIRKEIEIEPLMHGGAQERNRRGGTEPIELIAGFDEATLLAMNGLQENERRMRALSSELRRRVGEIEGARIITPEEDALPNIVDVTFDDAARLDGEALIVGMDLEGVAVSNGSACTSGSPQPSHVLSAIGLKPEQARAAVRFSSSRYTTMEEIEEGAAALERVVGRMR